jgi:hypothetical protein
MQSTEADRADLGLRARVRLARRVLDREIARGASPRDSRELALRVDQLTSAPERHTLAACLENILAAAEECRADPGSRVVLDHAAVIVARGEILTLIELLRSEAQLDARGVALGRLLIADPVGPLMRPCAGRTLGQAILEIADAL